MSSTKSALSATKEAELFNQLCTLLADLNHPQQVATVLQDFLTPVEQTMLSKRLQVGWLLHQKKSYETIAHDLGVSSATIGTVAKQVTKPGWQTAIKKIQLEKWAHRVLWLLSHPFPKDAIGV